METTISKQQKSYRQTNELVMAAILASLGQTFQPCRQASVDCRIHQEPQERHCNLQTQYRLHYSLSQQLEEYLIIYLDSMPSCPMHHFPLYYCLLLVVTFHLVLEVFARQLLLSGIVFPLTYVPAKLSQHSAVI